MTDVKELATNVFSAYIRCCELGYFVPHKVMYNCFQILENTENLSKEDYQFIFSILLEEKKKYDNW